MPRPVGHMLYAARFPDDDKFYRGLVIDFDTQSARILYLDYGNVRRIPFKDLHSLESDFCSLPFQAVRCCLADVQPPPGENWSVEAFKRFESLVTHGPLKAEVISKDSQVSLRLLLENGESVGEMMCKVGLGRPREVVRASPAEAPIRRTPDREATLQRDSPKSSGRAPGRGSPSPKGVKSKLVLYSDLPCLIWDSTVKQEVRVASAKGPLDISVILSEKFDLSSELFVRLNAYFKGYNSSYKPQAMDEIVCVQSEKKWYRGRCIGAQGNLHKVKLIDLGSMEAVPEEHLARIPVEFAKHPPLALSCRLSGVSKEQQWDEGLVEFYTKVYTMEVVKAERDVLSVRLFADGKCLNKELMSAGRDEPSARPCVAADLSPAKMPLNEDVQVKFIDGAACDDITAWCVSDETFGEQLKSLEEELQVAGANGKAGHSPVVGELVLANYSDDQRWYRAEVTRVDSPDAVHVRFVDYGNVEVLGKSRLALLPEPLVKYPCMGLRLALWEARQGPKWDGALLPGLPDTKVTARALEGGKYLVDLEEDMLQQMVEAEFLLAPDAPTKTVVRVEKPKELPTEVLHENDDICVVYANNVQGFYVCKKDNAAVLGEILQASAEVGAKSKRSEYAPSVGELVCGQSQTDQAWYRAQVVRVDSGHKKAVVTFVDFGNQEELDFKCLTPLPPELSSVPAQAIQLSLKAEFTDESKHEVLTALQNLTGQVSGVTNGQATDIITPGGSLMAGFRRDGFVVPEQKTEKEPKEQKSKEPKPHLTEPKQRKPEAQPTEAQSVGVQALPDSPGEMAVAICYINTPADFYVQLNDDNRQQQLKEVMRRANQCMQDGVTEYYPKQHGELLLALYEKLWYRAQFIQAESKYEATVKFLDYGNSCCVKCRHLRPLPSDLRELPAQAIHCRLDLKGTGPSGKWTTEAVTLFKNLESLSFTMKVLGRKV